ncbi:hypothetical protein BJV77DRAFT_1145678 [Russula vinacea]|nr:hypothetical protein BJV77DRAFT_1145678 [Russula vinacea]
MNGLMKSASTRLAESGRAVMMDCQVPVEELVSVFVASCMFLWTITWYCTVQLAVIEGAIHRSVVC